jgi:hypothetical protein
MTNAPRGFNSPEEYFQALDEKARRRKGGRKGVFYTSMASHHQTRDGRGTIAGQFGAFSAVAVGDSSSYDEAYGPPNTTRKSGRGYTGQGAATYDEGLQARKNSRDDAYEAEQKANAEPPKKQRKKKKK